MPQKRSERSTARREVVGRGGTREGLEKLGRAEPHLRNHARHAGPCRGEGSSRRFLAEMLRLKNGAKECIV